MMLAFPTRCDRETYHQRTWCRAEVMSHWARRGTSTMFYASEQGLEPMAPGGSAEAFPPLI